MHNFIVTPMEFQMKKKNHCTLVDQFIVLIEFVHLFDRG